MGARTRAQLKESLSALEVKLSAEDFKAIEDAIAASEVAGTRYGEPQMKQLDSEVGASPREGISQAAIASAPESSRRTSDSVPIEAPG